MALYAEDLIEEWFNRKGYFTIRGIKTDTDAIDLLAFRNTDKGEQEYLHIQIAVGGRPYPYVTPLTPARQVEFKIRGSANPAPRTNEQLKITVADWIESKFTQEKKDRIRRQLAPKQNWKFILVHGNMKSEEELSIIEQNNVKLIHIKEIIKELKLKSFKYSTNSATDLVEIIKLLKVI